MPLGNGGGAIDDPSDHSLAPQPDAKTKRQALTRARLDLQGCRAAIARQSHYSEELGNGLTPYAWYAILCSSGGDATHFKPMNNATTWDIVCAANQHLSAANRPLRISQFFPGKYEIICLDQNGATTSRRLGKKMDEQAVRAFAAQVAFA